MKAAEENMVQKPTDKLICIQGNAPLSVTDFIVFVSECNFSVFTRMYPLVGDCHPVRVIAQILNNALGAGKWFLAIDYLVFLVTLNLY